MKSQIRRTCSKNSGRYIRSQPIRAQILIVLHSNSGVYEPLERLDQVRSLVESDQRLARIFIEFLLTAFNINEKKPAPKQTCHYHAMGRDDHHSKRSTVKHTSLDERALDSQNVPEQKAQVDRLAKCHPGRQNPDGSIARFPHLVG